MCAASLSKVFSTVNTLDEGFLARFITLRIRLIDTGLLEFMDLWTSEELMLYFDSREQNLA